MEKITKKNKQGRPIVETVNLGAMVPVEMNLFIRDMGCGSPTSGMKLLWKKIKNDKKLLKKLKGE